MIMLCISKTESQSVITEYGNDIFQLYEFDLSAVFLPEKHNGRPFQHISVMYIFMCNFTDASTGAVQNRILVFVVSSPCIYGRC